MGSDNLHIRRAAERKRRRKNIIKQKSSNWLVICEGTKTEPNYFEKAVDLQVKIDKFSTSIVPYGKIFVVFDKDSFDTKNFDEAIQMCEDNGYIPLWSNQAIEFWFFLHFHSIYSKMDRTEYAKKLNEYFKAEGLTYKYKKNDDNIYNLLCEYGSLDKARKNAKKIIIETIVFFFINIIINLNKKE